MTYEQFRAITHYPDNAATEQMCIAAQEFFYHSDWSEKEEIEIIKSFVQSHEATAEDDIVLKLQKPLSNETKSLVTERIRQNIKQFLDFKFVIYGRNLWHFKKTGSLTYTLYQLCINNKANDLHIDTNIFIAINIDGKPLILEKLC